MQIKQPDLPSLENLISYVKKALGDRCVCCVLIACSQAADEKKMDVEMSFAGDEDLAAFLVENAGQVFEQRSLEKESQ